jgi:hypothetical protein
MRPEPRWSDRRHDWDDRRWHDRHWRDGDWRDRHWHDWHGRGVYGGWFFEHRTFGWPGYTAFSSAAPVIVIDDPFFCYPDGLGFAERRLFFEHLWREHGLTAEDASTVVVDTGGRSIFLGW